jgi:hypothetical protein
VPEMARPAEQDKVRELQRALYRVAQAVPSEGSTRSMVQPVTASIQRVRVPSWEMSDVPRQLYPARLGGDPLA